MMERYEIRQIDGWCDGEICIWNTSYHIGFFSTASTNVKRAFLNSLHKHGIVCKRGKCVVVLDGDIYTLQERKTRMPLYAAIPASF